MNLKNTAMFVKAFALTLGVCAFSCNDDDVTPLTAEDEINVVNQSSSSENIMEEELQSMELELIANPEGGRIAATCATVTYDKIKKEAVIDFGTGCTGPYGRTRSGKVIITFTGNFDDPTSQRTITFDNYFVQGKQITGKIDVNGFAIDSTGKLKFERKRTDLTIHFPDGHTFTTNGLTTVTWLEGQGDQDISNDVFSITGMYTGVSSKGISVTHTTSVPVIVNFGCRETGGLARVEGTVQVEISNGSRSRTRIIEYGDGTCDQTVTITINDKEYNITVS
jgi:hypothetical protein